MSFIVDLIAPERWNHVESAADCASRGMLPSDLLHHDLWWNGPSWLYQDSTQWPKQFTIPAPESQDEERGIFLLAISSTSSLLKVSYYSSFTKLKRATSWIFRFVKNCRSRKLGAEPNRLTYLTIPELYHAELYWCSFAQREDFTGDIESIKTAGIPDKGSPLLTLRPVIRSARWWQTTTGSKSIKTAGIPDKGSPLLTLRPVIRSDGLLRVGGRQQQAPMSYSKKHLVILHHKHPLTHLIVPPSTATCGSNTSDGISQ